jgi:ATP-binding cassette subfamily F protein 3
MRQALTMALQEYEGAVVLVSHDRHLLRTVADEFYIVHAGRAEPFDGDLDDYAKWLANAEAAVSARGAAVAAGSLAPIATSASGSGVSGAGEPSSTATASLIGTAPETAEARKQRKREEAERRNRLTPLRAAIEKCERDMERLAKERAEIETAMQDADLYTDAAKERLRALLEKQTRVTRDMEHAESQWLEHTERLESELRAQA